MVAKLGYWSATITVVLTIITFSIAIFTPPFSGPYCVENCYSYPYSDVVSRFPRDYVWMYPAIFLFLGYYALMVSIHYIAPKERKPFTYIGVSFALLSTAIFVINYFLQVSVIQPSLIHGETDGIALLSQFNPHGIFIALEEIGFLLMSLSLLFMAQAFQENNKLHTAIRWSFVACFMLTILSFAAYLGLYGINREYRFEVAVITINWLTLIISGLLLRKLFSKMNEV